VNSFQSLGGLLIASLRKPALGISLPNVTAAVFLEVKPKCYALSLISRFLHSTGLDDRTVLSAPQRYTE